MAASEAFAYPDVLVRIAGKKIRSHAPIRLLPNARLAYIRLFGPPGT